MGKGGIYYKCAKKLKAIETTNRYYTKRVSRWSWIISKMISNYESDVNSLRNASYSNLSKIAKVLGAEIEEIFLGLLLNYRNYLIFLITQQETKSVDGIKLDQHLQR